MGGGRSTLTSVLCVLVLAVLALCAGCDATAVISKEQAIAIAKETAGTGSGPATTLAPPGESTTSTVPLGIVVESAELIHTDAPGITGGEDMLVWNVKLGGSNDRGLVGVRVYIDAKTGRVLTHLIGP
ncbi:MAG: PepSY domain-containing protein [Thermoleophilia bacterium]|nr:PepSY domain-containing protein [Thermoleophilia bacterium]